MPAHSHNVNNQTSDGPQWLAFSRPDLNPSAPIDITGYATAAGTGTGSGSNDRIFSINNTGGGAAHENRPPYYALVYMIKT
jgi:microcystin-dependent protein